jgi:hypothetical protein
LEAVLFESAAAERGLRDEVRTLRSSLGAIRRDRDELARRCALLEASTDRVHEELGTLRAERVAVEVEMEFERRALHNTGERLEAHVARTSGDFQRELQRCREELRSAQEANVRAGQVESDGRAAESRAAESCAELRAEVDYERRALYYEEQRLETNVARTSEDFQEELHRVHEELWSAKEATARAGQVESESLAAEAASCVELSELRAEVSGLGGRLEALQTELAFAAAERARATWQPECFDIATPATTLDASATKWPTSPAASRSGPRLSAADSTAASAEHPLQSCEVVTKMPSARMLQRLSTAFGAPDSDATADNKQVLELCRSLETITAALPDPALLRPSVPQLASPPIPPMPPKLDTFTEMGSVPVASSPSASEGEGRGLMGFYNSFRLVPKENE